MAEIRQFGPDKKQPVPFPGPVNLSGVIIQLPDVIREKMTEEKLKERFGGLPLFLNRDVAVAALYLDPQGEINEHDSDQPTLFLVIGGSGFVQVGGPTAPVQAVKTGDAMLWPVHVLHKAWTEDEPMQMITIEYSAEEKSG
jgi:quercetin dioxygenase-like cupin family protein